MFTFDVHQYGGQLKGGHVTENDLYMCFRSHTRTILASVSSKDFCDFGTFFAMSDNFSRNSR